MNYPKAKSFINGKSLNDRSGKKLRKGRATRLNLEGSANGTPNLRKPSIK